ncbi:MAG: hypothetical protein Fur0044_45670 [Anaerolineae bacterium]|nr:hypothetical protein [Anaerolineales bacterium]MCQ3977898.1 hypothetical protein [Anaerolineae bacterium]
MVEGFHIELIQMVENAGRNPGRLARVRFFDGNPKGKQVIVLASTGSIHFQVSAREFVFTQIRPEPHRRLPGPELAPVQLAAQGLSIEALTGLPVALAELPTRQLMLPLLMCLPAARPQGV